MRRRAKRCGRLSHIIGQFKSAVIRETRRQGITFAWQTRFHDHIIRNNDEFERIALYIKNNPANWKWKLQSVGNGSNETSPLPRINVLQNFNEIHFNVNNQASKRYA